MEEKHDCRLNVLDNPKLIIPIPSDAPNVPKVPICSENQGMMYLNNSNDINADFDYYAYHNQMGKLMAHDEMRRRGECEIENYYDTGRSIIHAKRYYDGKMLHKEILLNSFDVEEVYLLGDEGYAKIIIRHASNFISCKEDSVVVDIASINDIKKFERFITTKADIANVKAFQKPFLSRLQNILMQKVRNAKYTIIPKTGWYATSGGFKYYNGETIVECGLRDSVFSISLPKVNQEVSAKSRLMKLKAFCDCSSKAQVLLLVSLVSVVHTFFESNKVPVVMIKDDQNRGVDIVNNLLTFNDGNFMIYNPQIDDFRKRFNLVSDDFLAVDVIGNLKNNKLKMICAGHFFGEQIISSSLAVLIHSVMDDNLNYDIAVELEGISADYEISDAINYLKIQMISAIEKKNVSITGLSCKTDNFYIKCETFVEWLKTQKVFDEETDYVIECLGSSLVWIKNQIERRYPLCLEVFWQAIMHKIKTGSIRVISLDEDVLLSDGRLIYLKKDKVYIETSIFAALCDEISVSTMAIKKKLYEKGLLYVHASEKMEYTINFTPISGENRRKAVAIKSSFFGV